VHHGVCLGTGMTFSEQDPKLQTITCYQPAFHGKAPELSPA